MPILAAKIAPQRSTQYATLASSLAVPELRLSPLAPLLGDLEVTTLAGQGYVLLDLSGPLDPTQETALWQLGATNEFFWFHAHIGDVPGRFLKPLEPQTHLRLPAELVEARRYRGKTNELFSRVLINAARWAHGGVPRVLLDPLMGGGTLPFIALTLGLDAIGIEQVRGDVESTDSFLQKFLAGARVRSRRREERAQGSRRTLFTIDAPDSANRLNAVLVHGDCAEAPRLLDSLPRALRPDLIAADLPYGIQHSGNLQSLLRAGLPAWHAVSNQDAVLALAWDATHVSRETMLALVEEGHGWRALRGGAWEELAHPVDRVIKRRDVVVAVRL